MSKEVYTKLSDLEVLNELAVKDKFDIWELTGIADRYTNEDLTFFRDCLDFMIIYKKHEKESR